MGALGVWHILIFAAIALLLFGGRSRISDLMGDVGIGIRMFRSGLMQPDSEIAPVRAAVTNTGREAVESRIDEDTVIKGSSNGRNRSASGSARRKAESAKTLTSS